MFERSPICGEDVSGEPHLTFDQSQSECTMAKIDPFQSYCKFPPSDYRMHRSPMRASLYSLKWSVLETVDFYESIELEDFVE